MRNHLTWAVILLSFFRGYSQPLALKEHFDQLEKKYAAETAIYFVDQQQLNLSNTASWLLLSYLNMYEATKDKAYLIKFMNLSIQAQVYRWDQQHPNDNSYPPKWTLEGQSGGESTYLNGLMLYPMTKFIHTVFSDPALKNTVLPGVVELQEIYNNNMDIPTIAMIDYGHFAWWLGYRVEQTLAYMNAFRWHDEVGLLKNLGDLRGAELNWQSCYGSALLYMGIINLNFPADANFGYDANRGDYYHKAALVAQYYNGNQIRLCDQDAPVLNEQPNYSYVWKHAGWRTMECNEVDYLEDITHGPMSLFFPAEAYHLGALFTQDQLIKFRNTFTKNIYYSLTGEQHFYESVYGTNSGTYSPPAGGGDENWGEVLAWSMLYPFDGLGANTPQPNVYEILEDHISDILLESLPSNYPPNSCYRQLSGPESLLGFSEFVKAQWKKMGECPNLTLKNRKITYDQDFNIPNILIIDPSLDNAVPCASQFNPHSFADPDIQTPEFTIEASTVVNLKAGERIVAKSGSSAKSGCYFHAQIVPSTCTDGIRMASNGSSQTTSSGIDVAAASSAAPITHQINVSPNPTTGLFTLVLEEGDLATINVYNHLGQIVNQVTTHNLKTEINLYDQSKGIYFLKVQTTSGGVYTGKVIVQ